MSGWLVAAMLVLRQAAPAADPDRLDIGGYVATSMDVIPRQNEAVEWRSRLLVDVTFRLNERTKVHVEGLADALVADRGGRVTGARVAAREAWVEFAGSRFELRAGYGRIAWGRLDEVQPSDVINPVETARFFFDGRGEARLPVTFVRGRFMPSGNLTIEGVLVPVFRRGLFDDPGESTSPFNLVRDAVLPASAALSSPDVQHREPSFRASNMQGGARVLGTIGRVDVAAGIYRGFDAFGILSFVPAVPVLPAIVGVLVEQYPRFTMISADFETVAGEWAVRGEVAGFVERTFQGVFQPGVVAGKSFDAGVGVDRRAGAYRLFAAALLHREWSAADPGVQSTFANLVGSIDRAFARERGLVRAFAVISPTGGSAFVRTLVTWSLRDNATIEGSVGLFLGAGNDTIARFDNRDFAFARIRYHF